MPAVAAQSDSVQKRFRKPGAPLRNTNAARHGLKGSTLPKDCQHIRRDCNAFRTHLENAVEAAHGTISLTHACFINRAFRAEAHARLCGRWLTKKGEKEMSYADRLNFSRELVRATEARDKAVAELKLPSETNGDPWTGITVTSTPVVGTDNGKPAATDAPEAACDVPEAEGSKDAKTPTPTADNASGDLSTFVQAMDNSANPSEGQKP